MPPDATGGHVTADVDNGDQAQAPSAPEPAALARTHAVRRDPLKTLTTGIPANRGVDQATPHRAGYIILLETPPMTTIRAADRADIGGWIPTSPNHAPVAVYGCNAIPTNRPVPVVMSR